MSWPPLTFSSGFVFNYCRLVEHTHTHHTYTHTAQLINWINIGPLFRKLARGGFEAGGFNFNDASRPSPDTLTHLRSAGSPAPPQVTAARLGVRQIKNELLVKMRDFIHFLNLSYLITAPMSKS